MLFVLTLTLALTHAQAAPEDVPEHFEAMAFLVGHCWEGTFPDGETTDRHCFEWMYGDKFIRDRHVVRGPRPEYRGETVYSWDAREETLYFRYWASDGGFSEGSARVEDGDLVFADEHHTAQDGTERVLRTRWHPVNERRFLAVTQELRDGQWQEVFRIDFERDARDRAPDRFAIAFRQ